MNGVGIKASPARAAGRAKRFVALLLGVLAAAFALSSCSPEVVQIVNLTKQDRSDAGLQPFEYNAELGEKAQALADKMCDTGKLSHSPLSEGVHYPWRSLAENIGYGDTLDEINAKWLDEPAYASNILSKRFTHLGAGACQSDDGTWFAVAELMQL